ncbi:HsdM family class I SAM-dependent methyltransferase [Flavobacterium psychrophilum]|uniref:HsdM family class I SAM-dependent methyltransferase n=1 Tax=Flavobacterium psychrophilum TaxID=96345 RepID=UPI000B7C3409|nr:class I SAM-dependent DNA methyltransferase [Flavobacterium psychrophilum]MBF2024388.1 SAM-dependent DNA methyltransferase [Flavobacterium psychrophilum]MCB5984132.1 type I restriction-modification system subunit M [Flavobacterium psychrophilum]MCB5994125.1 type I restriction-modification system subunit M [Flavobacterium psychrophilum]MCB5997057.1 type I restriction-modification system subunit M [Flavobacterium psychrophilum]MCB6004402.1 type I restriction-modification system subunit M [Fla
MVTAQFENKTKLLIDSLKGVCASYGLGNDGNEFKIITQVFLYKFMNDKFTYEIKKLDKKLNSAESWEKEIASYSEAEYKMLLKQLGADTARLRKDHYISYLFDKQNQPEFAKTFDDTLRDIAITNNDIFSVKTEGGSKITLFDRVSEFITDTSKRDDFCRAIINKLIGFSFEEIFNQKYDFFATVFEYLIKDYNKDGGGKYAEYYTPHAVAKIMAAILVDKNAKINNVTCYDPSAGSGTLLMNLAHAIGEEKCTIYSQDVSQKSSSLLRLNLILNNLVHSIQNVVQGDTMLNPFHKDENGKLLEFDYIVSNPPFKLDFEDIRENLTNKTNNERFFAGIPNVPKTDKDKMSIYTLFLQHIMFTLSKKGKAAIVVPTGFITAQSGIEKKIREKMVESKMLRGVVSMPSNIFATTGTNVSILFLDKENSKGDIVLMDASKLGSTVKEGKNNKTLLSEKEEDYIIETFNNHEAKEDFSIVVSYDDIKAKNYSLSAGQYFDVKIEYTDISQEEFKTKMNGFTSSLENLFGESKTLELEITKQLESLKYE